MTLVNIVTQEGAERQIDAADGGSLMNAIREAGIDELAAICGGSCSCATCHVWIDPDWIEKSGPARSRRGGVARRIDAPDKRFASFLPDRSRARP